MGTLRYVESAGQQVGLHRHVGYVAQVFNDGSVRVDLDFVEVDAKTVGFRAACGCGWRGDTFVERAPGAGAWPEWDDVPELQAEWDAHLAPIENALIELGQRVLEATTRWREAVDRQ